MFERIVSRFRNFKYSRNNGQADPGPEYEYCPNCYANLTMQRGYRSDLPYWICRGCGEMLINPDVDADNSIAWICDQCGAMLNVQKGFSELCGEWACAECGFLNKIDESELYFSEDEYQASIRDPYRGLDAEEVLSLALYQDTGRLSGRDDILLVRHRETGRQFVKKLLTIYNRTIYEYLLLHPILHMPKVEALYESRNCLIVIEEYIEGRTVEELLDGGTFSEAETVRIARDVCRILMELHSLPTPVIHRDIKPSNILIQPGGELYLLDMNAAKWYNPEAAEDTRYLGTRCYAAPEQVGYGLSASSDRSDIYAVGILMNVMLTGKYPKEQRAAGRLWKIIERCISLEAADRFTAEELFVKLDELGSE